MDKNTLSHTVWKCKPDMQSQGKYKKIFDKKGHI